MPFIRNIDFGKQLNMHCQPLWLAVNGMELPCLHISCDEFLND